MLFYKKPNSVCYLVLLGLFFYNIHDTYGFDNVYYALVIQY